MVIQKLCTEPKDDPQEAFRFAVAYEEGVNQHKASEGASGSKEVTQEPVLNTNINPCPRCGLKSTQNHLMVCKAKTRHVETLLGWILARMCKKPKTFKR